MEGLKCSHRVGAGDSCVGRTSKQAVKAQHYKYVALSEYVGALGCRIKPLAVGELGVCGAGSVEVHTWSGLVAGDPLRCLIETCRAEMVRGGRAWVVILLHGFKHNPFCWKQRKSDDMAMQRLPGVGVKDSGVGGTAGPGRESLGAIMLLPGKAICLMCMSGEGDNFCSF